MRSKRYLSWFLPLVLALLGLWSGCATQHSPTPAGRRFDFSQDTFHYRNDLVWQYGFDEKGQWKSSKKDPKPDYTHHCFVVARAAKQFFYHAKFDPGLPRTDRKNYRELITRVISKSPRKVSQAEEKLVIPGYKNLRDFSQSEEPLLKQECGGAWQSYVQRGHWRMMFPFSRKNQAGISEKIVSKLKNRNPVILHVVQFPALTINHAVVAYDFRHSETETIFNIYDPNQPEAPIEIRFSKKEKTFLFPQTNYFYGGPVDVYPVYESMFY
jgi:hypothetical protein